MSDKPSPIRVYTCQIGGTVHTFRFPHSGLTGTGLTIESNLRFQLWLDLIAPGARENGQVTGVVFTDVPGG